MDVNARKQYMRKLKKIYRQASKKEKSQILDEYCRNTGQNRKYAIAKINSKIPKEPKQRKRPKKYGANIKYPLVKIWKIFDKACGQRLKPMLTKEIVTRLRRHNEITVSDEIAKKLTEVSPATIDRLLKHQREVEGSRRNYTVNRNSTLYQKIPVKYRDFDLETPGFEQLDLVEHCGSSHGGEYANTLSSCDIATGWWEGEAFLSKAQCRSFRAFENIRQRCPFPLNEIHPDNDKTFINWHLIKYCKKENLKFSRSRPYKKNDNRYVEQKNSTHVRKTVGHLRYDTQKEIEIINSLYRNELRLYKNFFQPVMKLIEKKRVNGQIKRKYDTPKTPHQRIAKTGILTKQQNKELKDLYKKLNPAELKRNIDSKIQMLFDAYMEKNGASATKPFKKQNLKTENYGQVLNDLTASISVR